MKHRNSSISLLEALEPRVNMSSGAFEAHIDFTPANGPVASGYVADTGTTVVTQGNGQMYGWSGDQSAAGVDTKVDATQAYSTYIAMGKGVEWELIVPNGTYDVQVAVGDPTAIDSTYALNINGQSAITGSPTRKQHILQATETVTVTNGRLILSNDDSAVNTKLDSIDVVAADPTPTAADVKAATDENAIQAHGGDIIYQNGVYYWYGENKDAPTYIQKSINQPRADVVGVSVYESLDLHTWDYRGLALTGGDGDLAASNVLERPKVLYNARTKNYVMWMHIDNATYTDSRVGIAVSKLPIGPFTYVGSIKPLGLSSKDMTVFQDDDGRAYLIFATDGNQSLRIAQMNSAYNGLTGAYTIPFTGQGQREAPQLIKNNGLYYLITSGATWFDANAAMYAVSDNVLGKYTPMGNPVQGSGASNTYGAQGAYAFYNYDTDSYVLLADKWNQSDLGASTYVFMPIAFDSKNHMTIGAPMDWDLGLFA